MKTPEEMLKLSNMIPEKEWKSKLGPGFIAVKHDNGEALLDIAELVFDKETIEEALTRSLFIAASREFVPYAAQEIIDLRNKISAAIGMAYYFGYETSNENPAELKWAMKEICKKLGLEDEK